MTKRTPPTNSAASIGSAKQKRGTIITFNADELTALARYISAGMVLLGTTHPVLTSIKGGFTRLGLTPPPNLAGFRGPRTKRRTARAVQ